MNQNKLTFESEVLTVDYVTFNFEQLNESRKAHLILMILIGNIEMLLMNLSNTIRKIYIRLDL